MNWQDRLVAERSLLDVYKKARVVASTRANLAIAFACSVFTFMLITVNAYFFPQFDHQASLLNGTRLIADTGFALTSTLLGFLISGFAIFASITKPEVFVMLAQIAHKKSGISRLHFIFFNFLFVFIHYLAFLVICIGLKLIGYADGPLTPILSLASCHFKQATSLLLGLIFSALAGYTAFLLFLLKSFIWNMYQAVLITIGAHDVLKDINSEPSP